MAIGKSPKNYIDLTDMKISRLLVLRRALPLKQLTGKYSKYKSFWLCKCDCGKEVVISGEQLGRTRRGEPRGTQSCGCLQKEKAKITCNTFFKKGNIQDTAINCLISRYKKRAEYKKIDFNISKEIFTKLILSNCFYCNNNNSNTFTRPHVKDIFTYNGIDRIDPNVGYVSSNVVSCCSQCNYAKSDWTTNEFYDWIKKVYLSLENKNVYTDSKIN